jgi:hypothetical protein
MNMEEYQAEIIKIQQKYAANPTPENIAKMQQEVMELGMKLAGAVTPGGAGFDPSALASFAGAFSGDDDGDDEETLQFIKEHPAAADKAKYLPIGALLLLTNGEPAETFAIMGEKDDWKEALEEYWDMHSAADGKKMLASLLKGRHEEKFGGDYRALKNGKPHKLDDDSVEAYGETLENLENDLPLLLPFAKKCETLLAWDLERAGYLARIFVHLGWLKQNESFEWLEKTAALIKENFSKWEAYAASVLMGRALAMGFDYRIIGAAGELFEDKKDFLKSHPISALA